jgi:hypothetical protein
MTSEPIGNKGSNNPPGGNKDNIFRMWDVTNLIYLVIAYLRSGKFEQIQH